MKLHSAHYALVFKCWHCFGLQANNCRQTVPFPLVQNQRKLLFGCSGPLNLSRNQIWNVRFENPWSMLMLLESYIYMVGTLMPPFDKQNSHSLNFLCLECRACFVIHVTPDWRHFTNWCIEEEKKKNPRDFNEP